MKTLMMLSSIVLGLTLAPSGVLYASESKKPLERYSAIDESLIPPSESLPAPSYLSVEAQERAAAQAADEDLDAPQQKGVSGQAAGKAALAPAPQELVKSGSTARRTRSAFKATLASAKKTPIPNAAELKRGHFELVPAEHRDSIAGRLRLVEALILDYGRAYDYRLHTTRELEEILDLLRSGKNPPATPAASDQTTEDRAAARFDLRNEARRERQEAQKRGRSSGAGTAQQSVQPAVQVDTPPPAPGPVPQRMYPVDPLDDEPMAPGTVRSADEDAEI